jgi:hypothetical protein
MKRKKISDDSKFIGSSIFGWLRPDRSGNFKRSNERFCQLRRWK